MAEDGTNQAQMSQTERAMGRKKWRKRASFAAGLFLLGAPAAWWLARSRTVNSAPLQSAPTRKLLPLDSFIVNLADPEEGRFLRVTLSLGVDGELPQKTKGEDLSLEGSHVSIATIRDSILSVLSQCKSDDLLLPEGKLKLKMDLINALSRDVPALGAREVYFTEFLVQR
jgi:flagellar basal body-associated protein FliL